MKFHVRGSNIEVTDALRDYVEKKLSRLTRYFHSTDQTDAHISLTVLKDGHKVEVTIGFPNYMVRAEEQTEDMYASIDLVLQKLERQIRKYKTKVNRKSRQAENYLRSQLAEAVNTTATSLATIEEEEEEIEIVRTKRFNLKPMDTEEAILQMEMLGHNFFVFSQADTQQTSVVYRRKDGKYGLISPEA
ncbi:ribosome hibernation-promoting factor, HPF/YfiA family [Risungbinella massiliensis]|uniref:ribosome hibernation-promoting factor, HPF/YfiA family n=1 Tax=Risungbinella massiliensis TaxID=1329796 RepID=UPI0005CC4367|nr:ribosome-associated translation inhibitor RaiA [Risungbinella massiliensis]